ncbi:tetratricopeptide repeat protein [Undibacterium fentianense]|uniref:Tetratricopeptide repeat protein n=1 Tax=Undibacterium fentianense TaxID=2828728 RepID=A0A941E5K5_9BURK|nr:tetratricopeptide repeat protein [Undibacterium fentianense]MBR7801029.1 tetratricopeptide repeat protein [Undibacterium fentianense]
MKLTQRVAYHALASASLLFCSSTIVQAQTPSSQDKIPLSKPINKKSKAVKVPEDHNANSENTQAKDIMYKVTASEIALQRGEWQSAFVTILGLAQQTRDPRFAKRATEIAMSVQQLEEAIAANRLWQELDTGSQEAAQNYLSLMVVKNDYAEIEKFFVLALKSSNVQERGNLIFQIQRSLNHLNDKQAAFTTLEKILSEDMNLIQSHIALSRAAYRSGNLERAQKEAKTALSMSPDSELAILTLAQASEKATSFQLVADFLKQYPAAKDVRLAYASMLVDSKQFDAARTEFLDFLQTPGKVDLTHAQILYSLGSIELEAGQLNTAEKYFHEFLTKISENDDPSSAYLSLAQIALQRKDKLNADQWLGKIPFNDGKNPAWFNIQMRRAQLLASDNKFLEARQFLQNIATTKDSEQILLLQTEAQIMRDAGQVTEAFVVLQMALGEFPGSAELLYDFAMLAESLKQFSDMELALKQLIQIAPSNALAYNALGYSYADRNLNLDEAHALIETANRLNPNDPYILDSLGWIKFRLKQYEDAEHFLRRSLSMRKDADVAVHLAEVLWIQNRKDEAIRLFVEARQKDPQSAILKSTLLRLTVNLP